MKPRTQFERLVKFSNDRLTEISHKAVDWALRTQVSHIVFRTSGGKCTCGDCGRQFHYEGKGKSVKCPNCGISGNVIDTKKRKSERGAYFNTTEVIDGMQVVRTYRLSIEYRKGQPLIYDIDEISRLWLNAKGQTAVTAKRRTLGYYLDSFVLDSKIELRGMSEVYLGISDRNTYPHFSTIPELRRNGLKGSIPSCHPFLLMKYILTDSWMETLIKGGYRKAVEYFTTNHNRLERCWDSLKVAHRRGYEPEDYGLWCDLLTILDKLGRDIRSPQYICPDNLKEAHDRWNNKYQEAERRRRDREQLEKALKDEDRFISAKSRYFGIVLKDSDITISVLDSIEAYKAEGEAMHHCVFSASYYNQPDSVVLSARDKEGNRIETIEFSLSQGKVVQSRGVCNKNTEHHDRIVSLVNANAHQFSRARATA